MSIQNCRTCYHEDTKSCRHPCNICCEFTYDKWKPKILPFDDIIKQILNLITENNASLKDVRDKLSKIYFSTKTKEYS